MIEDIKNIRQKMFCKNSIFLSELLTNAEGYTIISFVAKHVTNVRLAQLDRAFGYGPKGREFESSNAHVKP